MALFEYDNSSAEENIVGGHEFKIQTSRLMSSCLLFRAIFKSIIEKRKKNTNCCFEFPSINWYFIMYVEYDITLLCSTVSSR